MRPYMRLWPREGTRARPTQRHVVPYDHVAVLRAADDVPPVFAETSPNLHRAVGDPLEFRQ